MGITELQKHYLLPLPVTITCYYYESQPKIRNITEIEEESDIYSFGMIIWENTKGKKPFYNRSHNHPLILDILEGRRPVITEDTPDFCADLMKKCWDPNPENRPTAEAVYDCLHEY